MNSLTSGQDGDLWLRRYHKARSGAVQLVCFPHAGGSASFFHPVSAQLAPDVGVSAVQYPGRQDRRTEPFLASIEELADAVSKVVEPLLDYPLAFFGHSMGALVAYETALRLESAGAPPLTRLFASGRRAPSTRRDERVHERDDAGVVAEVQALNGTQAGLLDDPEVRAMSLPAIRADYAAVERYTPSPESAVSCPVTTLIGADDPKVTDDEARAWAGHTSGPFGLQTFPGGHFYLMEESREVIDLIARELATERTPGV